MIPAFTSNICQATLAKACSYIAMLATFFLILQCNESTGSINFERKRSFAYPEEEQRISILDPEDELILPESDLYTILEQNEQSVYLRSTGNQGRVTVHTRKGLKRVLEFLPVEADLDKDGFPDILELQDSNLQALFLQRFLLIAELQLIAVSPAWQSQQRDCAGLVRFSYMQALQQPSTRWFNRTGLQSLKGLPAVDYPWPVYRILMRQPFKVIPGKYASTGQFSNFADAEHLLKHNTEYISKELSDGKPGDLLFFFNPSREDTPYHTMLLTQVKPEYQVIYHTGSEAGLKKVKISYLQHSPDFYPQKGNRNFMGVYRFKIIQ